MSKNTVPFRTQNHVITSRQVGIQIAVYYNDRNG